MMIKHECTEMELAGNVVIFFDEGMWWMGHKIFREGVEAAEWINYCPYCATKLEKSEKYDANVHAAAEFVVDVLCRRVMHRLLDQAADSMLAEAKS